MHVVWPAMELAINTRAKGRGKEKGKSPDDQAKERRVKIPGKSKRREDIPGFEEVRQLFSIMELRIGLIMFPAIYAAGRSTNGFG
jgi:hypothetical protein